MRKCVICGMKPIKNSRTEVRYDDDGDYTAVIFWKTCGCGRDNYKLEPYSIKHLFSLLKYLFKVWIILTLGGGVILIITVSQLEAGKQHFNSWSCVLIFVLLMTFYFMSQVNFD